MSKYYGTLTSDKGVSTRAGHERIRATAQSHDGSVSVRIERDRVTIATSKVSDALPSRIVWQGTLQELLDNQLTLDRCKQGYVHIPFTQRSKHYEY